MTYAEMLELGAPELPDGLFYHIGEDYGNKSKSMLWIMKPVKNPKWYQKRKSHPVMWGVAIKVKDFTSGREAIKAAAEEALEELEKQRELTKESRRLDALREEVAKFRGDHH